MRAAPASSHPRALRIDSNVVAGSVVVGLGALIAVALAPFVAGLIGAPVLAVVFAPMYRTLERRIHRLAAATIVLIASVVLVLIPGLAITSLFVRAAPIAINGARLNPVLAGLPASSAAGIPINTDLTALTGDFASWVSRQMVTMAGTAARAVANLVIAFFGLYYLLLSGQTAWRAVARFSPFSEATTERLRVEFQHVTKATLLGLGLASVAQALLIGCTFALTGLSNPWVWGAVAGVVSVLPILGASIVWLSGTVVLVAEHRVAPAIAVLLVGVVLSAHVDSIIRPIVARRVSSIHPLITLVGAFGGAAYIGLPGVLLGPLALAYFFQLVHAYETEFLGRGTPQASSIDGKENVTTRITGRGRAEIGG